MKLLFTAVLSMLFNYCFAQFNYIHPLPGSAMHHPEATIILKHGNLIESASVLDKSLVEIHGSLSGAHSWTSRLSDDNKTVVIKPFPAFAYGEKVFVTVQSRLRTKAGAVVEGTSFTFSIMNEISAEQREQARLGLMKMESEHAQLPQLKEEEDIYPLDSMPSYTININNNPAPGQLFFTSHKENTTSNWFSTIINNDGSIVWARDQANGGVDFKINESGYLTYYFAGWWVVMDSNFNKLDSFQCVNGYAIETDSHDFMMYPDGHVFLLAKNLQIMDMTPYGGIQNASVYGLVIQELDASKNLVFEWRSWDHFQVTDANAFTPLTNAIVNYCHGNSIEKDFDNHLMISCRNMNELTKINHETGDIIWRMGGDNNQFTFVNDNIPQHFQSQHDLRRLANGNILIYNNGNQLPVQISSAKEYALDEVNKIATLAWYYEHPDVNGNKVFSGATGNAQRLPNGNTLIDWGLATSSKGLPNFTEVDPDKNIVWEMTFDSIGYKSYRIHKYEWNPCSRITGYTMNATIKPTLVSLKWQPANGAKKYEIHYRIAGSQDWTVKTTGRTILKLTGLAASTKYEWRVKTLCTNDGAIASAFSETKTFKTKPQKDSEIMNAELQAISIYPVPASTVITITIPMSGESLIRISNTLGRVVYESKTGLAGSGSAEVNVKDWPHGLYLVEVLSGNQRYVEKAIVN